MISDLILSLQSRGKNEPRSSNKNVSTRYSWRVFHTVITRTMQNASVRCFSGQIERKEVYIITTRWSCKLGLGCWNTVCPYHTRALRGTVSPRPACFHCPIRSTCSWRVTIYVGKPSAVGQLTKPTQHFVLPGSINWVVSNFIGCALVAPSGECSRG